MSRRLPDHVKASRGTLEKSRANPNPPHPRAAFEIPSPPPSMAADEKTAWEELRAAVNELRIASSSDFTSFRVLVGALVILRRAERELLRSGFVSTSASGARKICPELSAWTSASKVYAMHAAKWALYPTERDRAVALPPPKSSVNADPEAEFY